MTLHPKFVELMPNSLEEGVLYISMVHAVAIHNCACGCRQEVVTPLAPSGWLLFFDGIAVSLRPSIGNWSFDCRSHYFITRNEVVFCIDWDDDPEHASVQAKEKERKKTNWWKNFFK